MAGCSARPPPTSCSSRTALGGFASNFVRVSVTMELRLATAGAGHRGCDHHRERWPRTWSCSASAHWPGGDGFGPRGWPRTDNGILVDESPWRSFRHVRLRGRRLRARPEPLGRWLGRAAGIGAERRGAGAVRGPGHRGARRAVLRRASVLASTSATPSRQIAGLDAGFPRYRRGTVEAADHAAFAAWRRGGRLVGVESVNQVKEHLTARKILAAGVAAAARKRAWAKKLVETSRRHPDEQQGLDGTARPGGSRARYLVAEQPSRDLPGRRQRHRRAVAHPQASRHLVARHAVPGPVDHHIDQLLGIDRRRLRDQHTTHGLIAGRQVHRENESPLGPARR